MRIEITFPDNSKKSYPSGITTKDVIKDLKTIDNKNSFVAVRLNNKIVNLSYKININSTIESIKLSSKEGTDIYKRTLCFLLSKASKQIFPDRRLVIGHSLGEGYYYYFDGIFEVTRQEINLLSEKIKQIVAEDQEIQYKEISYMDAVAYFEKNNLPHTALLIKYNNRSNISIYKCGDFIDLSHGPLISKTGILKNFEIMNYPHGFILRFPLSGVEKNIPDFKDNLLLFSIYKEYKSWGKILNMNCIGLLNELINEGRIKQFIQVAEALHDKKIANIADRICEKKDSLCLILIAGPSSSGKTTFAKKLAIQLKVLGRNPVAISLDDYFLPRDKTPLDSNGKPDFEALEAIDITFLNDLLTRLFNGMEVEIPHYDFVSGNRNYKGNKLKLPHRSLLILEGIHGLNDKLTQIIDKNKKFKIYVSALTQLNLDDHNRISTKDNRLLRRIVRDNNFRGSSAIDTLRMWPQVQHGEESYIFPFQNTADAAFNSALDYELAVLKVYAEPLLRTIRPNVREYAEVTRLLAFLSNVLTIPPTWVPSQSILREFIGESDFKY